MEFWDKLELSLGITPQHLRQMLNHLHLLPSEPTSAPGLPSPRDPNGAVFTLPIPPATSTPRFTRNSTTDSNHRLHATIGRNSKAGTL